MRWISDEISKKIADKIQSQRIDIIRTILTLSSGAIVLTFTTIQILQKDLNYFLIKVSWFIFGFCILLALVIQLLLITWEVYWQRFIDEQKSKDKNRERINSLGQKNIMMFNLIPWLELIMYVLFFLGIVLLIIFLSTKF